MFADLDDCVLLVVTVRSADVGRLIYGFINFMSQRCEMREVQSTTTNDPSLPRQRQSDHGLLGRPPTHISLIRADDDLASGFIRKCDNNKVFTSGSNRIGVRKQRQVYPDGQTVGFGIGPDGHRVYYDLQTQNGDVSGRSPCQAVNSGLTL